MTSYSTPTAAGIARFASIQFCRCLAATLIVLYHTDLQIMRLTDGRHLQLGFGAAGTDMLFVISGFVLVLTTHGRSVHIGSYIFKRFARIAPLYWAFTLGMLAMFLIAPALFYSTALDTRHVLASMLFIPYAHPVIGKLQPFLVPGWALNQIAFFYVLFGLGLLLPSRFRVPAVTLVLVALVMRRWFLGDSDALLDFYGMPVVLDFALGMLVCRLYLSQDLVSGPVIGAVFAVSAAIFAAGVLRGTSSGDDRILYWGIADAGVLFSLLSIERTWGWWNPGLMTRLGDASFSIYLSNLFTLAICTDVIRAVGAFPTLGVLGTKAVLVGCALAVGLLIGTLVERPLNRLLLTQTKRAPDVKGALHQSHPTDQGIERRQINRALSQLTKPYRWLALR
jgi:exopolysaccharide production protein ExoZ